MNCASFPQRRTGISAPVMGAFALAVLLAGAAEAPGQISLFMDFDGGSLDLANTTIDLANPSAPAIDLEPRHTWNNDATKWWAMHFQADGFLNTTPQFTLPIHWGAYPKSDQRMVYSYDQTNWQYFDNGLNTGVNYTFSNNTPFTQDRVWVSSIIPYPVSKTEAYVDSIKSNPYVHPTTSADPNMLIGMTPGTAGGWYAYPTDPNDQTTWNYYLDDLGRTVQPQKLQGFKITDASATGPKTKVVITVGNHPSETLSHYGVEGLVNKLVSSDPRMAELRQAAEFYVYPQLNPEGRYYGYYRTSPVRPTAPPADNGGDHNRMWEDTPHSNPEVEMLKAAMRADTGGTGVDYFFDFHSGWWSHVGAGHPNWTSTSATSAFALTLAAMDPDYASGTGVYNFGDEYAQGWSENAVDDPVNPGLGAVYAGTQEFCMKAGTTIERYQQVGENFALSFYEVIVPEPATLSFLALGGLAALRRRR